MATSASMPGPLRAGIAAGPDVLDALQVVDEVLVGGVGEAGVLVLLVAGIEGDGEALRHQLEPASTAMPFMMRPIASRSGRARNLAA